MTSLTYIFLLHFLTYSIQIIIGRATHWRYSTQEASDQQLGSMGLFFDPDLKIANTPEEPEQTQVLSVCNPQSPGKEWIAYVMNDSYTQLFGRV